MPADVRARIIPASATPMPPRAGEAEASKPATVTAMTRPATERCAERMQRRPEGHGELTCQLATEQLEDLPRRRGQLFEVALRVASFGLSLAATSLRQRGASMITRITSPMTATACLAGHRSSWWPRHWSLPAPLRIGVGDARADEPCLARCPWTVWTWPPGLPHRFRRSRSNHPLALPGYASSRGAGFDRSPVPDR